MRTALIPLRALRALARHPRALLIGCIAALLFLPFALSRDPEICVLNAIGLGYVLFQFRRIALSWAAGMATGALQRRRAEHVAETTARKEWADDDGTGQ